MKFVNEAVFFFFLSEFYNVFKNEDCEKRLTLC